MMKLWEVQLSALSSDIEKVVFGVTIHDADGRRQMEW